MDKILLVLEMIKKIDAILKTIKENEEEELKAKHLLVFDEDKTIKLYRKTRKGRLILI
jgi:hypothetical protein